MADTNIKFLKENNLYDAHKHFMRMVEGFGYAEPIEEAGPDDQYNGQGGAPQDPSMGGQDPSMGDAPQDPSMGAQDPSMGGMNGAPQDPSMGGGMQDPSMGGQDPSMGGGMQDPSMGAQDPSMADTPQDDEDVIDVDDMVKAQEKTNNKVNDVGRDLGTVDRRIEKLLGALESMQDVIDKNNAEIASLKNEFEKRNPTQTEKLNLRSLNSYPFNVNPVDYWKDKSENSNYDAYSDNNEPTTQEYTITNYDVDDLDSNVDKTFDIPDDDIQDINKIFNS